MKWIKKHLVTIIIIAVLLVGLGFLFYPTLADYWNSFHQSRAIAGYTKEVAAMDPHEYEKLIADAHAYNRRLSENGINWKMSDEELEAYYASDDRE